MALILCNGCGKSFSEDAASCPHCGRQTDPKEEKHYVNEVVPTGIQKKSFKILFAVGAVVIALLVFFIGRFFRRYVNGPHGFYGDKSIYFMIEFDGKNTTSQFLVGGSPVSGTWEMDDEGNVTVTYGKGTEKQYIYNKDDDTLSLYDSIFLEKLEGEEKDAFLKKASELNLKYLQSRK